MATIPAVTLRSTSRVLLGVALALGIALAPVVTPRVAARARVADAPAPVAVTYHLAVLLTQGPGLVGATDGQLDGQVAGTLDATGTLTATLTATTGATATVTGAVSDTVAGVRLSVQGATGVLTLSGHNAGPGGYGGTVAQAGLASVGAWLLTPEPVAHSYAFVGSVARGGHRGLNLGGTLAIAATAEPSGRFDGTLTLDDGTVLVAEGQLAYGNLQVIVHVPGAGVVMGVASPSLSYTPTGDPFTLFTGTFAGPTAGDTGVWRAGQTS